MKKTIKKLIITIILIFFLYVGCKMYKEFQIRDYKQQAKHVKNTTLESTNIENITIERTITKENTRKYLNLIPKEYKGYKVDAKLEIEKLEINTYVLKEYSKPAMEVAVAKYYGPKPNEQGNYCIAGHNYIRKNMFSQLGKLEKGDKFTLTDNWNGQVQYEVYDKYKALPTNIEPLSQKTDGKKEVTLITCCDYSKKRIIIKAVAI